MKNKITLGLITLVLTAIISSCSVSNDVASNRKIQKRKYNKGFFISNENISFNKKNKKSETVYKFENDFVKKEKTKGQKSIVKSIEQSTITKEVLVNTPKVEVSNSIVSNTSIAKENTNSDLKNEIVENKRISGIAKEKNTNKKIKISQKEKKGSSSDDMLILLVILALFIPPLAVLIYEGVTKRFWINLILYVLVITAIIAVIHALLIILEVI